MINNDNNNNNNNNENENNNEIKNQCNIFPKYKLFLLCSFFFF